MTAGSVIGVAHAPDAFAGQTKGAESPTSSVADTGSSTTEQSAGSTVFLSPDTTTTTLADASTSIPDVSVDAAAAPTQELSSTEQPNPDEAQAAKETAMRDLLAQIRQRYSNDPKIATQLADDEHILASWERVLQDKGPVESLHNFDDRKFRELIATFPLSVTDSLGYFIEISGKNNESAYDNNGGFYDGKTPSRCAPNDASCGNMWAVSVMRRGEGDPKATNRHDLFFIGNTENVPGQENHAQFHIDPGLIQLAAEQLGVTVNDLDLVLINGFNFDSSIEGGVKMTIVPTTSTTRPTETTEPPPPTPFEGTTTSKPTVRSTPSTLPATGDSSGLHILGAAGTLILAGGALVLVRRRPA